MKRFLGGFNFALSLWLALAGMGCVSADSVARRVLKAPNLQMEDTRELKLLTKMFATNFPAIAVSVGPPAATVEMMVIEPGDYNAKMESSITKHVARSKRDNYPYDFNFGFSFDRYPPKATLFTNAARGTIFLLHGYGMKKEVMVPWGVLLAKAGYRTVLVDLRGHGQATGGRIYFGAVERTDMAQCLDALKERGLAAEPVGVLGISYGAVVALQWAAVDARVKRVVAISPFMEPGAAVETFLETYVKILPRAMDRKAGREVASRLAAEGMDLRTEEAVRRIGEPILFVRGEHDELCSREDLAGLQAVAAKGSAVVELPRANHLVAGMCVSQLRERVVGWFGEEDGSSKRPTSKLQ